MKECRSRFPLPDLTQHVVLVRVAVAVRYRVRPRVSTQPALALAALPAQAPAQGLAGCLADGDDRQPADDENKQEGDQREAEQQARRLAVGVCGDGCGVHASPSASLAICRACLRSRYLNGRRLSSLRLIFNLAALGAIASIPHAANVPEASSMCPFHVVARASLRMVFGVTPTSAASVGMFFRCL